MTAFADRPTHIHEGHLPESLWPSQPRLPLSMSCISADLEAEPGEVSLVFPSGRVRKAVTNCPHVLYSQQAFLLPWDPDPPATTHLLSWDLLNTMQAWVLGSQPQ